MNEATLLQALRHYGHEAQKTKCLEELAELQVAIHHGDKHEMAEECADVLIMASQLRLMLGPGLVDGYITEKLARLAERMAA